MNHQNFLTPGHQGSYVLSRQHDYHSENNHSFASNSSVPLHQTQARATNLRNSQVFANITFETSILETSIPQI